MASNRGYTWPDLPHQLQTVLSEFKDSIEASQAEARKAAKIGEAVMAAAKPIEIALRDFAKRITELEKSTEASEKQSAELKSSLVEGKKSWEANAQAAERSNAQNAQAIERINAQLGGFSQELKAITDQLSNLKQTIETGISQQKATDEEIRAINTILASIRTRVDGVSRRVDLGEQGQARLSALTESVNDAAAALKTISEETAQRISALESRVLWRLEGLETLVNSTLATINRPPKDEAEDIPNWR